MSNLFHKGTCSCRFQFQLIKRDSTNQLYETCKLNDPLWNSVDMLDILHSFHWTTCENKLQVSSLFFSVFMINYVGTQAVTPEVGWCDLNSLLLWREGRTMWPWILYGSIFSCFIESVAIDYEVMNNLKSSSVLLTSNEACFLKGDKTQPWKLGIGPSRFFWMNLF